MSIVLQKQTICKVLFFACIAIPYLNKYELTFATWFLTGLVTFQNTYSKDIFRYVATFAAILAIAIISGLFREVKVYDFIRDVTYLLKPAIGLLAGYQLCKRYLKNPMGLIVNAGFIIAVIHLLVVVYAIVVLHAANMHKLREYSGYFSDFEVYALVVLIFKDKFNLKMSQEKFLIMAGILSISVFLYLARTNFIQLGILLLAVKGYVVLNKRSLKIIGITLLSGVLAYGAIYYYNPSRSGKGFEGFLYKIKIAPTEPFKTKINVDNWKDFNDNYRSYETILTLRQMPHDGSAAIIFGKGAGSSLDLNKKVWLQDSFIRFIPFMHNGFMTVLLKSGIVGVLILIYSLSLFFRYRTYDDKVIKSLTYLLIGTGVYMILSYWVFMGFYFVVDTKSVVVGFLIAYRENLIHEKNAALV